MTPQAWRFLRPLHQKKWRVVFAGPHFQAGLPSTRSLLASRGLLDSIDLVHAPTRDQLLEEAPTADIALPFMEFFDEEFLQAATQLRLIQQFGVGLERVDVKEATSRGIAVSNVPALGSGNAESTAEQAIMLALTLLRSSPKMFERRQIGGLPLPRTLYGKQVTVVGYGAVGSTLCRYLMAMGADVTAIRNRQWCPIEDQHMEVQKLECLRQALPKTQVLILACTVTPETWHLLNQETLALLPDGAVVVNVARGPLVEYEPMLAALKSGKVAGFASDVGISHPSKPSEPWDPTDEISSLPNTIFTPHIGGYVDITYGEEGSITKEVVRAIECIIKGEPPPNWCNKSNQSPL